MGDSLELSVSSWGVPLVIIHFERWDIFPFTNKPSSYWGISYLWKPPYKAREHDPFVDEFPNNDV